MLSAHAYLYHLHVAVTFNGRGAADTAALLRPRLPLAVQSYENDARPCFGVVLRAANHAAQAQRQGAQLRYRLNK